MAPRPDGAYPRTMEFARALVAVVALVIGVPLAIIGLALVGPAGWVTAAVVLPPAALGTILWVGRSRQGDGEPPRRSE
jgi:membrane protease YdiL (CAAX protease family)